MRSPIYESDPEPAPDSDFVDAEFSHLLAGNRGRLRDVRRTPFTVTGVMPAIGRYHEAEAVLIGDPANAAAMIRPDNDRSIRVAERLGMRALRPDVLFDLPVVVYSLGRHASEHQPS